MYLDSRGLVAVWREGLLAKKVLEGRTRGYTHHPQLLRFKESLNTPSTMACFLLEIYEEAARRNYSFDRSKIGIVEEMEGCWVGVSDKQVEYEWALLRHKLRSRGGKVPVDMLPGSDIKLNRAFRVRSGEIEGWERVIPGIV